MSSRALAQDLAAAIEGEVRFDAGSRALYAHDLSIYRQVPIGVVVPRTVEDVVAAVEVCHRHEAPPPPWRRHQALVGQHEWRQTLDPARRESSSSIPTGSSRVSSRG